MTGPCIGAYLGGAYFNPNPHKTSKSLTDNTVVSLNTPEDPLTELIRQGARDLIAQAVEAELQQLLAQHQSVMVMANKPLFAMVSYLSEPCKQVSVMSKYKFLRYEIAQGMASNLIVV